MECKTVNIFYFNENHLKILPFHDRGFTPCFEYPVVAVSDTLIKTCDRIITKHILIL